MPIHEFYFWKYPFVPVTKLDDFANAHLYAYVLAEDELTSQNWRRDEIEPFQINCSHLDVWQPLHIRYRDAEDRIVLSYSVSDGDPFIRPTGELVVPDGTFDVTIESVGNARFEYFQTFGDQGFYLQAHFIDRNGLEHRFNSMGLTPLELQNTLKSLEVVGDLVNFVDPWKEGCRR